VDRRQDNAVFEPLNTGSVASRAGPLADPLFGGQDSSIQPPAPEQIHLKILRYASHGNPKQCGIVPIRGSASDARSAKIGAGRALRVPCPCRYEHSSSCGNCWSEFDERGTKQQFIRLYPSHKHDAIKSRGHAPENWESWPKTVGLAASAPPGGVGRSGFGRKSGQIICILTAPSRNPVQARTSYGNGEPGSLVDLPPSCPCGDHVCEWAGVCSREGSELSIPSRFAAGLFRTLVMLEAAQGGGNPIRTVSLSLSGASARASCHGCGNPLCLRETESIIQYRGPEEVVQSDALGHGECTLEIPEKGQVGWLMICSRWP